MSTERNWYPEKGGSPLCSLQLADAGRRGDVIFPLPPSHPRSVKEVCHDCRCGNRERSLRLRCRLPRENPQTKDDWRGNPAAEE